METFELLHTSSGIAVQVSRFAGTRGAEEYHLCVTPGRMGAFEEQLGAVSDAYHFTLEMLKLPEESAIFRRLFVSDYANQVSLLERCPLARTTADNPVAVSIVEQPPLAEHRIALWAYHIGATEALVKEPRNGGVLLQRGSRKHLWTTGLSSSNGSRGRSSYLQSRDIFDRYLEQLASIDANLKEHVIRTWLFVQSIDVNYQGMVDARRELFDQHGLTAETHYIVSTGIEGRHADPTRIVLLDAYAIAGIDPKQIRFLKDAEQIGPTSDYGMTFERGVRVDHGDRSHVFISGTASIDSKGRTLHERDVRRQVARTFLNIEGLLSDAGASDADIAQMIVYARDPGDRLPILDSISQHYPGVPRVFVRGPVYRPTWLVEIECIAVLPSNAPQWPNY